MKIIDLIARRIYLNEEYCIMLNRHNKQIDSPKVDVEFRFIDESNVEDTGRFEDATHYAPIYREKIRNGEKVVFGYCEGKCIYRLILSFPFKKIRGMVVTEPSSFISYGVTDKEYRNRGIHTAALKWVTEQFPEVNHYSFVSEGNIAAIRSMNKAGFECVAKYVRKNRFFIKTVKAVCNTLE